jgi:uncharacterized protein YndB with AHSA1/START domain
MTVDTIEREIFINAEIGRVWSLVSKTGFWVGEELRFDTEAREGETVVMETEKYGSYPVRVERLEPPRYAAYRWAPGFSGAELTDANATRVEFTLVEQDGGVMLRLKESGFASVAGDEAFRDANRADNVEGWAAQLERLREVAEGVPQR